MVGRAGREPAAEYSSKSYQASRIRQRGVRQDSCCEWQLTIGLAQTLEISSKQLRRMP